MTEIIEVDPSSAELVPVGAGAIESVPHTHAHPTPQQYVLIAVVLVIITAVEVATSYLEGDVNDNLIIAALGIMAAVKFFLVVAWYMHLHELQTEIFAFPPGTTITPWFTALSHDPRFPTRARTKLWVIGSSCRG